MIDANEVVVFLKWLASVVAAASVVLGALYKVVTAMVTKKVKEQLTVSMRELTEATSNSIDALREDVKEQHQAAEDRRQAAEERQEKRLDAVTRRIDDLLGRLTGRGP